MKKVFACLLCFALLTLTACGGNEKNNAEPTVRDMTTTQAETLPPDDGIFDYLKTDLPKGWTVDETHCTSTYLQAVHGEKEDAPMLSVSVFQYDDADGSSKAKSLAEAVHSREIESSSDIAEAEIGGLPFYLLSFASKTTEGKLRYEGYGQTPPDENGDFHFVIVALENVRDDEEYTVLKPVLDSLEFKF